MATILTHNQIVSGCIVFHEIFHDSLLTTNVEKRKLTVADGKLKGKQGQKIRGPEPRPLLQATILFHLRGHLIKS